MTCLSFGKRAGACSWSFRASPSAMFDEFHEESKLAPAYCPFQLHPYISGRPGRAKTLRSIIQHMKKADGVWFATGSEVARWCLDEVFKVDAKAAPRVAAVS